MQMSNHGKKKIAPIVITVLILIYYGIYFGVLISLLPSFWKIVVGIVPLLIAGVMLYVCIQRIREIDEGEEDDLSKY